MNALIMDVVEHSMFLGKLPRALPVGLNTCFVNTGKDQYQAHLLRKYTTKPTCFVNTLQNQPAS